MPKNKRSHATSDNETTKKSRPEIETADPVNPTDTTDPVNEYQKCTHIPLPVSDEVTILDEDLNLKILNAGHAVQRAESLLSSLMARKRLPAYVCTAVSELQNCITVIGDGLAASETAILNVSNNSEMYTTSPKEAAEMIKAAMDFYMPTVIDQLGNVVLSNVQKAIEDALKSNRSNAH